jgi:hypothetical protein
MPEARVTNADCSNRTGSTERSKNSTLPRVRWMSTPSAKVARIPSAPPQTASAVDSVSSARTIRPRLAPSDARIAISCSREVHCAIIRIATFAHAMTRVSSTDAAST